LAEDLEVINKVIEPETGLPAIKLGLLRVEKDEIHYTPPSPFTPPILVISVGLQLKSLFKRYKIVIENYYISEEINERLNYDA